MKDQNTNNQYNQKTDNSEIHEESKFRPISAVNKRPEFMLKKQHSINKKG